MAEAASAPWPVTAACGPPRRRLPSGECHHCLGQSTAELAVTSAWIEWRGAGASLPVDVRYSVAGPLAGASGRGAVAG
jgi:hypothetical protein